MTPRPTTAKVEADNTAIKIIKRTGRGFVNRTNYKTRILLRSAARTAMLIISSALESTTKHGEPCSH
jgi:hypothetical protein